MSETANYKLFITDDDSMSFLEWRKKLNGETGSNMTKIDAALGNKAERSVSYNAELISTEWDNDSKTQVISVTGLTASQNGSISVAQEATEAAREAARNAMLSVTGQADNTLTITADGDIPECNIPVVIIVYG